MNTQARKIWNALNPKVGLSCAPWRDAFPMDTLQEKILARVAAMTGNTIPSMPSAQECLAELCGTHLVVLHSGFKNDGIDELEAEIRPGVRVKVLEIHPVQFAWVVGRAADARAPVDARPVDVFIRDAKRYKRPVRA